MANMAGVRRVRLCFCDVSILICMCFCTSVFWSVCETVCERGCVQVCSETQARCQHAYVYVSGMCVFGYVSPLSGVSLT